MVKITWNAVQSWEVRLHNDRRHYLQELRKAKKLTSRIVSQSDCSRNQRSPKGLRCNFRWQREKTLHSPLPQWRKHSSTPKASTRREDSWVITYTNAHSWEMMRLRKHSWCVRYFNIFLHIIIIFFYTTHSDRFFSRKFATRSSDRSVQEPWKIYVFAHKCISLCG